MDSQQSCNGKHQNCSLPNIFSELLELYGSQNLPFSQSSTDGNSISIDDHHHVQQSEKFGKSSTEDFVISPAVGTGFPICSDGHDHHHVLDQGVHLEQERFKSSSGGNIGVVFSCTSSSKELLAPRSRKPRIKWKKDLHEKFIECVNSLGGAEKATPKKILKLMNTNVVTIFHVKSHLQKYRTSKDRADHAKEKSENIGNVAQLDIKSVMQIKEALEHVNRHLHEQLEIQHNLQLLIEEQGKQLKMMLHQQQKTNKNLFMDSRQIPSSDSRTQNNSIVHAIGSRSHKGTSSAFGPSLDALSWAPDREIQSRSSSCYEG